MASFTLQSLYPRVSATDTHWIGGWVGSRDGLNAVVRRKILSYYRDSNPPVNKSKYYFKLKSVFCNWKITGIDNVS